MLYLIIPWTFERVNIHYYSNAPYEASSTLDTIIRDSVQDIRNHLAIRGWASSILRMKGIPATLHPER